eukprot:s1061_g9.t1
MLGRSCEASMEALMTAGWRFQEQDVLLATSFALDVFLFAFSLRLQKRQHFRTFPKFTARVLQFGKLCQDPTVRFRSDRLLRDLLRSCDRTRKSCHDAGSESTPGVSVVAPTGFQRGFSNHLLGPP